MVDFFGYGPRVSVSNMVEHSSIFGQDIYFSFCCMYTLAKCASRQDFVLYRFETLFFSYVFTAIHLRSSVCATSAYCYVLIITFNVLGQGKMVFVVPNLGISHGKLASHSDMHLSP